MKWSFFKKVSLIVVCICYAVLGSAQEEATPFDSVFNHVVFNVISTDAVKAKHLTDSLLKHAVNGRQRVQALMLLANLSIQANSHEDALVHALNAEEIAKKEKDYEWQIRTGGFLSAIFRDANLIVQAREHLKVVESANKQLKNSIDHDLIQINIHHENAHFEWRDGNYEIAIQELQSAQELIPLLAERLQEGYFSSNYLLLGESYLELNDYEKAEEYFHLALNNTVANENLNYASIYTGLGDIELDKKNYTQAFSYYEKAEEYLPSNQHFSISLPLYKSFSKYYKEVNMARRALHYDSLYIDAVKSRASFTERLSDRLVQERILERKLIQKRNVVLFGALGSLFILVLVLSIRLYILRKNQRVRYEAFIKKTYAKLPFLETNGNRPSSKKTSKNGEDSIMPKETEERLLSELEKLEEKFFFINKDLSLSALATELQTNTKYLSYIINTHKEKDFSNYIHELRIKYAVDKLQNDPQYLHYKLAYLATECGYSSHSKFASAFKSITGLSPSTFISYVKKEGVK